MSKCPSCGEVLKYKDKCPCGWRKEEKARSFRCVGSGCNNMGSISLSTKGDQWYCRKCFAFLKGTDKPRDKQTALNTVQILKERLK